MYTSCWIGISIQMSTSWVDFTNKFLTSLYRSTLLRIYFRNLSVQRSFLQYKSQCMEKVNVKYVIKILWHEIFHIVPGINPRPISALQLRCRAWYGSPGLIPRPIWKMSCNNLLIWTGPSPKKYYMDLRSFGPYNIFLVTDRSTCHYLL
jgi:hypothetical protein